MAKLSSLCAPVNNRRFLESVFGSTEHAIWLAAFAEDPSQAPPGVWGGAPYRFGEELFDEIGNSELARKNNTFVCISCFTEVDGAIGRRIECFAANYCVVLDDVGSKVPLSKLTIKPSWVLETSPKNYQVGYLWHEPLSDAEQASAITNALARQGYTDESAHGATRYVRLPQGVNNKAKYGEPFRHVMRVSASSVRYRPDDLIAAFGLDLEAAEVKATSAEISELAASPPKEGSRNQSLAQLAGHLLSSYFGPPAVAYELLMKWAQCCEPPIPPQEADATIRSIWRRERRRRERDV